ncbi:MAG: DNA repair protein RecN [Anaerolineae bacterium]|nr:DNA repair protein RecN [Anaerolineae bacterium]
MLRELHIKDFAIVDELHLVLEPGFCILTGETGAGKSILLDAISLLLGGRADTSAIRAGASRARVEGLFNVSASQQATIGSVLEREGLEGDSPGTLWLSRELRRSGRTVARVNGSVVSVSVLREVAQGLVDIHGQSEHLSLLRISEHLKLLDRYADLDALRAQVAGVVRQLQKVRQTLRTLRQGERDRMQRIDLLKFQVQEIRSASLRPGEKDELEVELIRLSNAEKLSSSVSNLLAILEEGLGEGAPVLDLLGKAQRELIGVVRVDSSLEPQAEVLESVGYQLEDFTNTLRDYLVEIEFNPKRLAKVESRLTLLRQLERKYGADVEAVLAYATQAAEELETLEHSDEQIEDLELQESELLQEAGRLSLELSQKRQAAAISLSAGVDKELADLRMSGARFGVAFEWRSDENGLDMGLESLPPELWATGAGLQSHEGEPVLRVAFDATGMDQIQFLIAPNVGEGLKPMAKVASGGETARLMLALKTVLSRADRTPTLIFDEIDQGIGGRVGVVVGMKLWQLTAPSKLPDDVRHQVLCVTHLPQLAGFGDAHYRVKKKIEEGRTITHVKYLDDAERLTELAQMLGTHGDSALQGAQDLLDQARKLRDTPKINS